MSRPKLGIAEGIKRSIMALDRIHGTVPLSPEMICDTIDAVAATAAIDAKMALIEQIRSGASISDLLTTIRAETDEIKPPPRLTTSERGAA